MTATELVNGFFSVLYLVILLRVLWSWVDRDPYSTNAFKRLLYQFTEPLLEPIRQIVPPVGGAIDLSPLITLVLLQVLQQLTLRFLSPG